MQIVLTFLYLLVGFLLAIPYCLLAGWSTESYPMVAFVMPAFLFIWLMLAFFTGVVDEGHPISFNWRAAFGKGDRRRLTGSPVMLWAWTIYGFLPVTIHWSAVFLGKVGYETASSFLDAHRYGSPFLVLIATFILLILSRLAINASGAAKNIWTRLVNQ